MPSTQSRQAVYEALKTSGLPVTWDAWPVNHAPPLPWIAFAYRRDGEVYADNDNYAELTKFKAQLYYREYDPAIHQAFLDAISKIGPYRMYDDIYVESERCYMAEYDFTYHPNRTEASDG